MIIWKSCKKYELIKWIPWSSFCIYSAWGYLNCDNWILPIQIEIWGFLCGHCHKNILTSFCHYVMNGQTKQTHFCFYRKSLGHRRIIVTISSKPILSPWQKQILLVWWPLKARFIQLCPRFDSQKHFMAYSWLILWY